MLNGARTKRLHRLHAHALRVTRPTRDGSEVLLLVESQRTING